MAGFPWRPTPWFRHHHFQNQKPVVAWPSAEMWIPTMASEAKSSSGDRSGMVRYPCGHLWTALNDHKIKLIYIYHYIYISYLFICLKTQPKDDKVFVMYCVYDRVCIYNYVSHYLAYLFAKSPNHIHALLCICAEYIYIYVFNFIHHSIKLC